MDNTADLKKQIDVLENKLQKEREMREELATTFVEQVEEIEKLKHINRKLCEEVKEKEHFWKKENKSIQARMPLGYLIGGILFYLMLKCFANIDDWSFGLSFGAFIGTVLKHTIIGAAYSFGCIGFGEFIFILIKDAENKKSVTIRILLTIVFSILCMTIKSLLF